MCTGNREPHEAGPAPKSEALRACIIRRRACGLRPSVCEIVAGLRPGLVHLRPPAGNSAIRARAASGLGKVCVSRLSHHEGSCRVRRADHASSARSALRRTPSLRSLVLLRCAQSPSFAALSPWLRHAAGFACGLFVFEAAGFACGKTLSLEHSHSSALRFPPEGRLISLRAGVVALFLGRT